MTDHIIRELARAALPNEPNAGDRIIAAMDKPEPVELRADFWDRMRWLKK